MYGGAMPEAGGLWDELMGLVDQPTVAEPTDEPQGVVVGRIGDDGEYTRRDETDILNDHYAQEAKELVDKVLCQDIEHYSRIGWSRVSLASMGFKFIDESDSTLFEQLGGTIATGD